MNNAVAARADGLKSFFSNRSASGREMNSTRETACQTAASRRTALFGSPLAMISGSSNADQYLRDEHFQDNVIVDSLTSLFTLNCLDELSKPLLEAFNALLEEHLESPTSSRLRSLVPGIGIFFTPIPFAEAFEIYNQKYHITKRKFVPPTFHEVRHVMNVAQVLAITPNVKLVTFDGDETLYPDGKNFEDLLTAEYITTLLRNRIAVAVVTAAGYGYQAEKYETRLMGLLAYFKAANLPSDLATNFYLFGGESNYLFRCSHEYRLEPVLEAEWRPHVSDLMKTFFLEDLNQQSNTPSEISRLLDISEEAFEAVSEDLGLRATVIRKERAVGLVPGGDVGRKRRPKGSGTTKIKPEILEETVFRVRGAVDRADPPLSIPYCAFNGGHDVWVDVGNKAEGLLVLQSYLNILPQQCLHIGDQFSVSGNDLAARDVSPTLWICNPSETKAVLKILLRQFNNRELLPRGHSFSEESEEDWNP